MTDREKTTLEGFEDTLKIEDAQWQVRDLATRKLIVILPSTEGEVYSVSSSGRFAYASRGGEVRTYAVPVAPE